MSTIETVKIICGGNPIALYFSYITMAQLFSKEKWWQPKHTNSKRQLTMVDMVQQNMTRYELAQLVTYIEGTKPLTATAKYEITWFYISWFARWLHFYWTIDEYYFHLKDIATHFYNFHGQQVSLYDEPYFHYDAIVSSKIIPSIMYILIHIHRIAIKTGESHIGTHIQYIAPKSSSRAGLLTLGYIQPLLFPPINDESAVHSRFLESRVRYTDSNYESLEAYANSVEQHVALKPQPALNEFEHNGYGLRIPKKPNRINEIMLVKEYSVGPNYESCCRYLRDTFQAFFIDSVDPLQLNFIQLVGQKMQCNFPLHFTVQSKLNHNVINKASIMKESLAITTFPSCSSRSKLSYAEVCPMVFASKPVQKLVDIFPIKYDYIAMELEQALYQNNAPAFAKHLNELYQLALSLPEGNIIHVLLKQTKHFRLFEKVNKYFTIHAASKRLIFWNEYGMSRCFWYDEGLRSDTKNEEDKNKVLEMIANVYTDNVKNIVLHYPWNVYLKSESDLEMLYTVLHLFAAPQDFLKKTKQLFYWKDVRFVVEK